MLTGLRIGDYIYPSGIYNPRIVIVQISVCLIPSVLFSVCPCVFPCVFILHNDFPSRTHLHDISVGQKKGVNYDPLSFGFHPRFVSNTSVVSLTPSEGEHPIGDYPSTTTPNSTSDTDCQFH